MLEQMNLAGAVPIIETGGPTGNFLRLTDIDFGSTDNLAHFDKTDAGPYTSVVAEFDFRMNGSADGFSFQLIPTDLYGDTAVVGTSARGFQAERPTSPGVFGVGFRIYGANNVSVNWNGLMLEETGDPGLTLTAGVFHHAKIEFTMVDGTGKASVTLTPDVHGTPGAPLPSSRTSRPAR